MYDITAGIMIRQVQNALPVLSNFKKLLMSIIWMNLLVVTKQPYSPDTFHIILNVLLQIMMSESWSEKLPIWPRGIYCCFVNYAQEIPLDRI